jgi:hypothetical protein
VNLNCNQRFLGIPTLCLQGLRLCSRKTAVTFLGSSLENAGAAP